MADPNRDLNVDLDFELYHTLLDGEDDGRSLPIPERVFGVFNPRNCFNCMVGCHERPRLISVPDPGSEGPQKTARRKRRTRG